MATTRTIELKTDIPGPRSGEIVARLEQAVSSTLALTFRVVAAETRGITITDVDGNTFIDFAGGVGCLNVGHSHPHVVAAAQEQLERFSHTDFGVVPYEVYVTLAERLLAYAPFKGPGKAAFFNAGTEAVENAVKLARLYTGRPAVIGFEGAFHGRTLLSLTLTSKSHPYKAGLGPFAPEVYRTAFPYEYRGVDAQAALAALEETLQNDVAVETVAAIVIEPVLGEGGFVPAPAEFLRGLRRVCDENGIVLVADEVQTGFGLTGKFFAIEAEIMDAGAPGAGGGTYVGNPVAQAAALAVLDVIEDEGLVERSTAVGETIRARMLAWQERWPEIGDVRGLGSMLAIELVEDRSTQEPAGTLAAEVVQAALARGLMLITCGTYGNCIRVLVPLVITDAELDEALGVWEEALDAVLG